MKTKIRFTRAFELNGRSYKAGEVAELDQAQAESLVTIGVAERTGQSEQRQTAAAGSLTIPADGIDYDAMAQALVRARAQQDATAQGDGRDRTRSGNPPALNANAGREEDGQEARDGDDEDTRAIPVEEIPHFDAQALAIEEDPRRRAFLGLQLYRLFRAQARRNWRDQEAATNALALRGFYGEDARQRVVQGQRAMDTLSDADGGVFIPTVVYNEVLRIVPTYGVIRRLARVITGVNGPIKIPSLAGGLVAFWVAESAEIKARAATFSSVTLDPEKIGLIVPWTSELREEVGASLLNLIVELIAEAFGLLEDTTALYGDGSATYGGITGLANKAGVNAYNLGGSTTSGSTGFADITYDDLLGALAAVPAPVRRMGTWVFSPDTELALAGLKDTNGRPIFQAAYTDGQMDRLLGRPVEWSQAAYDNDDSAVSTVVGFYGDFSRFIIAQGRSMTSKLLTEATITDVDDSTEIKLGAQDMEALRMTERLDMNVAIPNAFVKLVTAAS